ncbi:MAG: YhcH/YjgK/YiaL family protein [Lentisphaeria bacterium]|jgi:YhcH/YjgK/YiaL family protein|nr:YhcH/YjgK/YiaL family protein [Lentisphaeria bacterium]MDY0176128.1 YhcH/YjgK/YiaL family protein [Lentisphaeria bacterium]
MIYDNWENLTKYSALMPDAIAAIEEFMATVTAETLSGSYPLIGNEVKASVFDSKTNPLEQGVFEIHRQYMDLQTMLIGEELNYCRVTPKGLKPTMAFDAEKDYQLFDVDLSGAAKLLLKRDCFVIYFPEEAHLTSSTVNGDSQTIKKIVFKIRYHNQQAQIFPETARTLPFRN